MFHGDDVMIGLYNTFREGLGPIAIADLTLVLSDSIYEIAV